MTKAQTKLFLKEWRDARGLTQQQVADEIGRHKTLISKLESGNSGISDAVLNRLARLFNVRPGALFQPPPVGTRPLRDDEAFQIGTIAVPKSASKLDSEKIPHLEVPVFPTMSVPQADMKLTFEPVEFVARPAPLLGVRNGFAIYTVGHEMEPAYHQGDLVFVHPNRPVGPRDDALLLRQVAEEEYRAVLRHVTAADTERLHLRQLNPDQESVVQRSGFDAIYLVVGRFRRQ